MSMHEQTAAATRDSTTRLVGAILASRTTKGPNHAAP
ncbi:MAG: hypothetical protein JWM19_5435 [Actinomycetia bacterium]|nr:hypothetical protein [Actinomycetes bacterium]